MKKWHKHFGVYGIVYNDSKVLLVKKTVGPYIGRYDLPGGTLNADESILKHLAREFLEETGYSIIIKDFLGVQDFRIEEKYLDFKYIHHIALFYKVELLNKRSDIKEKIDLYGEMEKNDSAGICWVEISKLCINNASPLVVKALSILDNNFERIEKTSEIVIYDNWTRKEIFEV